MGLRIRQVVFAARDLETTVAGFAGMLGTQVVYRDPGVAAFGLENALLQIGDQFLEVVAPTRPETAAGRHLARHGDAAYMLILQSDDLARDRERLERLGVRIVWEANHSDISAVHLHPKDIGAAIVSLDQPVPPHSWRWAGPQWQEHPASGAARRIVAVSIAARDPAALAHHWAKVLDTQVPHLQEGIWSIPITGGQLNFVASPAGVEQIVGYVIETAALTEQHVLCATRFNLIGAAGTTGQLQTTPTLAVGHIPQ